MDVDNTLEIVQKVLQQSEARFKSTEVHKDLDVDLDLGNLLASDPNPFDITELRLHRENYLLNFARDNVQLLVNELWKLPIELVDNVHVAKLPAPKTVIPREKPAPAEKKKTRWEEYSQKKGIQKRKKGRMAWDETAKEWKPRWGYKRANDDTKDWLLEVPDQADINEDMFAKKLKAKKENYAKNELQRLRNIARNMKGKVPGVGLTPVEKPDKDHVARALSQARKSTASIGKFDESLPKEKPLRNEGKKRKFETNFGDMSGEKKRSLDILTKVQSQQPILDTNKAASRLAAAEQSKKAASRKTEDSDERKKKFTGKKGKKGNDENDTRKKFTGKKGKKGNFKNDQDKGRGKGKGQGKGKKSGKRTKSQWQ